MMTIAIIGSAEQQAMNLAPVAGKEAHPLGSSILGIPLWKLRPSFPQVVLHVADGEASEDLSVEVLEVHGGGALRSAEVNDGIKV